MAHSLGSHPNRLAFIDNLKALACLMVLIHHLAFYGPMSDVALQVIPRTIDFFYEYGRMAVSVFLAIGGFLTGQKLSQGNLFAKKSVFELIGKKYLRLVVPYSAAIALAITCSFVASLWMTHESISSLPEPTQLLTHLFFLQNILGYESLSAGLWYVAIDFQLFAISALTIFLVERLSPASWSHTKTHRISLVMILLMTLSSLFIFNLHEALDVYFIYFFAAYGLGFMGAWAIQEKNPSLWLALLALMVIAALYFHFRERLVFAGLTALTLSIARWFTWDQSRIWNNPLAWIGQRSYSIFLIHFPISLLVSAAWSVIYPTDPWLNVVGMGLSALVSLLLAIPFYQFIEKR